MIGFNAGSGFIPLLYFKYIPVQSTAIIIDNYFYYTNNLFRKKYLIVKNTYFDNKRDNNRKSKIRSKLKDYKLL